MTALSKVKANICNLTALSMRETGNLVKNQGPASSISKASSNLREILLVV